MAWFKKNKQPPPPVPSPPAYTTFAQNLKAHLNQVGVKTGPTSPYSSWTPVAVPYTTTAMTFSTSASTVSYGPGWSQNGIQAEVDSIPGILSDRSNQLDMPLLRLLLGVWGLYSTSFTGDHKRVLMDMNERGLIADEDTQHWLAILALYELGTQQTEV